jgi:hypothetical protein
VIVGVDSANGGGSVSTVLFFVAFGESFLSPSTTLRLRGRGLCTKVHSCLWNSHRTQRAAPSLITQRLFLLRQASQGRSLLERMLDTGPVVEVGLPAMRFSLPGEGLWILRGRAAAIGTGVGRGIAGCIAIAVVISISGGNWRVRDKAWCRKRVGMGLGAVDKPGVCSTGAGRWLVSSVAVS